jgi:Ctr copper transporter family
MFPLRSSFAALALLLVTLIYYCLMSRSAVRGQASTAASNRNEQQQELEDVISSTEKVNQSWRADATGVVESDAITIAARDDNNKAAVTAVREMKDILDDTDDMPMPDDNNTTEFCKGMYMTMFMDGFHWTLLKQPSVQCLNYFVRSWRLENAGKFKGAMLFTFLLAVLIEGLSSARVTVVHSSTIIQKRQFLHGLLTAIYGLQALLGYILMLVTMSFSIELVASVIAGLMVGNLLFMRYDDDDDTDEQRMGHLRLLLAQ